MAHKDVYEEKSVTASIERKSGKTGTQEVEFEFVQETKDGDKVLETMKETLKKTEDEDAEDAEQEGAGIAKVKWKPPAVEPRDKSYNVTIKHKLEDFTFERYLKVWPQKGKLTVLDEDQKALKGFQFKVVQGKEENEYKASGDPSVKEFPLKAGKAFKVEAIPPFEVLETLETGHEVKVKGKLSFKAEFVDLDNADKGTIKQYVNEDGVAARKGRDNKGNEITLRIGVEGDRDKEDAKRVGAAGVFAFFKLEFGAESGGRSKRNKPVAEIKDGLNLTEKNPDGTDKFKGKVELAGPENTGEFKIDLGLAGGDNCTVKIGGTDACADASVKFVNWRKLRYETIYPTCAEGQLNRIRAATAQDTGFDFPAAIKTKMTQRLGAVFVEYDLYRSHSFTKAQAEAVSKTWVTADFLKLPGGAAERFYATDYTHAQMADNGVPRAFDGNADKKLMRMKIAHRCFYKGAAKTIDESHDDHPAEIADARRYFLPMNADDGTASIDFTDANNKWTADLAADTTVTPPINAAARTGPGGGSDNTKTVTVRETGTGKSITVDFVKTGMIGNIPTDLSAAAKETLTDFIKELNDDAAVRTAGITIEVEGPDDNSRRTKRRDNIIAFLGAVQVFHPALDENGDPRTGQLTADMFTFHDVNTMKITFPKAAPTDPGHWVGPAGDDKCPIQIRFDIVTGSGYNGMVWKEHQLVALRPDATHGSVASTFCHELGHSMGMTIMAGQSKEPPGLDPAKHLDNGGDYYRNANAADFAKGIRTTHSGSHCAHGLSDADKGAADIGGKPGADCIMWGAGGNADTRPSYCDTCQTYLKGRKLTDTRGSWSARGDEEY